MIRMDYEIIFVHIPKTAGNSISDAIRSFPIKKRSVIDRAVARIRPQKIIQLAKHAKASEIKEIVGNVVWYKFFSFCVVRNPWDTMVSSYFWWLEKSQKWEPFYKARKEIERMEGFESFLMSKYGQDKINQITTDMWDYITDEKGKVIVDCIVRFENIQDGWKVICSRVGVHGYDLKMLNCSQRREKGYRKYYTEEMRDTIEHRFTKIIDRFGYKF